MLHKACFEAVNGTLNDVCNSGEHQVVGGIPIVLGGDFAQILPVSRRGSWQATVLACIRHSSIWANLQVIKLSPSMGVIANDATIVFLTFFKDMITTPQLYRHLELPASIHRVSTVNQLCDQLYPQP